jgi:hypothetical protein
MPALYELCTETEWEEASRGQHRAGPKPLQHEDVAAAICYLRDHGVGSRVKVRCSEDHANQKRDAARDHAYRKGVSVTTRYHRAGGFVLIESTK